MLIIASMHKDVYIAEDSDAEQICVLVNRAYRPNPGEAGWTHESALVSGKRTSVDKVRNLLKENSTILVMKHGKSIVACVHVERVDGVCWIGMLATAPNLQARGMGKMMLASAEAFAVAKHASHTLKMAVLSSRSELLDFYRRRGFALNGNISAYPLNAGVGTPQRDDLQVLELQKTVA